MTTARNSPPQVDHVRKAILREFTELIDMSDAETKDPSALEQSLVSRGLAAMAVRLLVGCDSATAAGCVIDGRQDGGIDAIAFADGTPELFLIQAKWSDRGTAGIKAAHVRDLVDGFRKIENQSFARFNERFLALSGRVQSLIQNPKLQVTLVLVVMGNGEIHPDVEAEFATAVDQFNSPGRFLHRRVLTAAEIWEFIRADMSPGPVGLVVPMMRWLPQDTLSDSYFGTVSVDHLADWFQAYGDRLFESNVRKALGLTAVNQQIVRTLLDEPESFWAKNNGITVLCSAADKTRHFGSRLRHDQPLELTLSDARVVNGAQTVHAAYRAAKENRAQVEQAEVMVRVIAVPPELSDLGRTITESTNTQNQIELRDFIALDETQAWIRDDFMLGLGLTYVFHRGESAPPPDSGCTVAEAALALACAHPKTAVVVRTKINPEALWERASGGHYPLLFDNQPPALEIWRSVLLHRRVRLELESEIKKLRERGRSVAEYGNLLLTHLCFQLVESDERENPETDWDAVLDRVGSQVAPALHWLIVANDDLFGAKSFVSKTFADNDKCRVLVGKVLTHLRAGTDAPALRAEYQPPKKPPRMRAKSAVSVILDSRFIAQGTELRHLAVNAREAAAMSAWLDADPRRRRATWVVDRSKPLLWEADGHQYSPTGLIMHMWALAEWGDAPVAVQGPRCWEVPGQGSLAAIAEQLREAAEGRSLFGRMRDRLTG
ncbi:AIPR family protein [Nocardia asteroides]|uniref:AIPR family protein n=1 Tax=Nocardia asteroides TaxID=1824 RepID=UPI003425667B